MSTKRKIIDDPSLQDNHHTKLTKYFHHHDQEKRIFPCEILLEIMKYLPITDLCSDSLVCKQWNDVAHNNHLWKSLYEKQYKDHPFSSKDPLFGGDLIENLATFKFSKCLFKAMFALKKSFYQLQVISKQNIYPDMVELFEGDQDEGFTFKEGEENFEPTLEMKQMIKSWTPSSSDDEISGNKYGYFICEECAENENLIKVVFKNPLTEQGKNDNVHSTG